MSHRVRAQLLRGRLPYKTRSRTYAWGPRNRVFYHNTSLKHRTQGKKPVSLWALCDRELTIYLMSPESTNVSNGLACGTFAMVQYLSPFYQKSIHAGDGKRTLARATALFQPSVTLISFPDNSHQFYCRYTPLQTLTIPVIIETSSEH